jgi:thiol-disulfide isomerase/thioredoxin
MCACKNKEEKFTKIIFHIKYGYDKKFRLETIPFEGEKIVILDSGISKAENDSLVFKIPLQEERLFAIKADEVNMNIMFINDAHVIDIYARYDFADKYSIQHSSGTTSLNNFIKKQDSIAAAGRKIKQSIDSFKQKNNVYQLKIDSCNNLLNSNLTYLFNQYKNYADTVSSVGALLAIFNNIDFDKDYTAQKKFILHIAEKFPNHSIIQKLKKQTLDFIKIFEEEYNVGDKLPPISLPDNSGKNFSTNSLSGKYYLIDFWSTWCNPCINYLPAKELAAKKFSPTNFQIVSVAIDDQKNNWYKIANDARFNWHQLIDTMMWRGDAVKTIKFDSIPFNFLVSPDGIVLAKAIKPDSLIPVISKYIKPVK